MNQKDYKKIAEIMKDYKQYVDEIHKKDDRAFIAFRCCLDNLADYFEEEDKALAKVKLRIMEDNENFEMYDIDKLGDFNKKQFLKDCGV